MDGEVDQFAIDAGFSGRAGYGMVRGPGRDLRSSLNAKGGERAFRLRFWQTQIRAKAIGEAAPLGV